MVFERSGEERLLAAVAHLGLFIAPVLIPLLILLWARQQSHPSVYLKEQSLQAVVYQALLVVLGLVLGGVLVLISFWLLGWMFVPAYCVLLLLGALYAGVGAYQALLGNDFRYYFLYEKLHEFDLFA